MRMTSEPDNTCAKTFMKVRPSWWCGGVTKFFAYTPYRECSSVSLHFYTPFRGKVTCLLAGRRPPEIPERGEAVALRERRRERGDDKHSVVCCLLGEKDEIHGEAGGGEVQELNFGLNMANMNGKF